MNHISPTELSDSTCGGGGRYECTLRKKDYHKSKKEYRQIFKVCKHFKSPSVKKI